MIFYLIIYLKFPWYYHVLFFLTLQHFSFPLLKIKLNSNEHNIVKFQPSSASSMQMFFPGPLWSIVAKSLWLCQKNQKKVEIKKNNDDSFPQCNCRHSQYYTPLRRIIFQHSWNMINWYYYKSVKSYNLHFTTQSHMSIIDQAFQLNKALIYDSNNHSIPPHSITNGRPHWLRRHRS